MAHAMMYPIGEQGKRTDLLQNCKKLDDEKIDASAISRACFILRNNPIADDQSFPQRCLDIMAGLLSLTEAYELTQAAVNKRRRLKRGYVYCPK